MSAGTELELQLTSDTCILGRVRAELRRWMIEQHWTELQIAEIERAVDESLTNVIRHGYGGNTGHPIHVHVVPIRDAARGEGVEIRVRDFGREIEPADICGRSLDDPRPGGLGVHIIRHSMDHCEYSRAAGGGMQLVMQKFKDSAAKPSACDGGCR